MLGTIFLNCLANSASRCASMRPIRCSKTGEPRASMVVTGAKVKPLPPFPGRLGKAEG